MPYDYVANDGFAAGSQVNVHAQTQGSQERPAIARLADGGFIAVWAVWSSGSSVKAQRYDANGHAVGAELLIAAQGTQPTVTGLASGGYAIAWSASDASGDGVWGRAFDASGTATGAAFAINTATVGSQQQPVLKGLPNGDFVAAWTDSGNNGIGNIKARVFTATGTAVTADIVVTASSVASYDPSVAVQADGDFVVTWTGERGGSFTEANGQIFTSAGVAVGAGFSSRDSNSGPSYHSGYYSAITVLASGEMVMTWTDDSPAGILVMAQRLSAAGVALAQPFLVDSAPVETGQSSVTALDNGGFVITWRADTPDAGVNYIQRGDIYAQVYAANGAAVGSRFLATSTTALAQDNPHVVQFGTGDLAFVWRTFTGGAETDVAMRIFYSTVHGDGTDNVITGTPGVDLLFGLGGNDTLTGLQDNDQLDGGAGSDNLAGDDGADTLDGGDDADTLYSGHRSPAFSLPYYGNPFTPPLLDTGTEVDTLRGGNGDDWLFAGYGDNVDGGANSVSGDYLFISFQGAAAGVHVDFQLASQTIGGGTITGIENISWVEGSNYDDYIDVTSNGNTGYSQFTAVFGMGGNDWMVAGYYTGVLYGGAGNDYLDGTGSQYLQRVDGGDGDDQLYTNTNTFASAWGGDGNDTIVSHAETHGGAGNDVIHIQYSNFGAQVWGDEGDDVIWTAASAATIHAGAGNDLIRGDDGEQSLYLYGDEDNDFIIAGDGDDTVDGGTGNDGLYGGRGADTIRGSDGDDAVGIGAIDDLALGESGDGGAGYDTLQFYNGHGNNALAGIDISGFVFTGFEVLRVEMTVQRVTVNGTQFSGFTSFLGGEVAITDAGSFAMAGKKIWSTFILSSAGSNSFDLTGAILGGDMSGGTQDYFVFGGGAADTITGSAIRDMLAGGGGNDTLFGAGGRDYLSGEDGNDRLFGGADDDYLFDGAGDDMLDGGTGADQMAGSIGNDSYIVDNAGDSVFEAATGNIDSDTVTAYVSYTLASGQEIERLRAGPGTDPITLTGNEFGQKIQGNDGANILTGGGGNDNLVGNGGADVLIGGTGLDKLTGGAGADRFVFASGGQMDMIVDFAAGTDKIDLTAFGLTWAQVQNAMTEAGGNTNLDLGGGNSIRIAGVAKASLGAGDFLLGGGSSGGVAWIDTLQGELWDGGTANGPQHALDAPFHAELWHGELHAQLL